MLEITLWYLFLGVVFNFIVDMSTEYARKRGVVIPDQSEWTFGMRAFTTLIWPLGLIYYVRGYVKERFKTKK